MYGCHTACCAVRFVSRCQFRVLRASGALVGAHHAAELIVSANGAGMASPNALQAAKQQRSIIVANAENVGNVARFSKRNATSCAEFRKHC